ncbi:hypothetical protein MVEN_02268900 [Mycena venus]|uniref:Uncharacterized protein n=1 Tax=Mycena venus TaxID=2733690 RepID=A0A8H6X4M8_9AGAR|nr:hypothetical protein MVEN_02268900 [Mycena venus]
MESTGFLDLGTDVFQFRCTRSGRSFSQWEAVSARTFDIAAAISKSLEANVGQTEDLAELNTGPPVNAIATTESTSSTISWVPNSERPLAAGRKACDKAHSKLKRGAEHATAKLKADVLLDSRPHHPRHLLKSASPIWASFEFQKVCVASMGWVGIRDFGACDDKVEATRVEYGQSPTHRLHHFFGPGRTFDDFKLVPYLGPQTRPLLDAAKKVVAVFAGMPDNPNFIRDIHNPAVETMKKAAQDASISDECQAHRHGLFPQLTFGDSMGGGQVKPGQLVNGVINTAVLLSLLSNSMFIRLAGFATGAFLLFLVITSFLTHYPGVFANWAPKLFDFYVVYMGAFYKRYPKLHRPFLNGIFSACTFNLGPQTCALGHHDHQSLAFGWCAITALEVFDYKKGGHLILWDCKLVIEFPPGCTILIPSATIYHSNIPISLFETHYSFTQYTAGGLFHWVDHDFKTEEEYWETLDAASQKEEKKLGLERAEIGAGMFSSTLEELKAL